MSMKDLKKAFELIHSNAEEADFEGPKTEELLKKAELKLELTFPPTYRTFLCQLGCGDIAGVEFYGIINDDFENSSVPDAIWLTLDERISSGLPKSHIIIGSTGDGGYYAIDNSTISGENENLVVEWWPGVQQQITVAEDFGKFFLQSICEALGCD